MIVVCHRPTSHEHHLKMHQEFQWTSETQFHVSIRHVATPPAVHSHSLKYFVWTIYSKNQKIFYRNISKMFSLAALQRNVYINTITMVEQRRKLTETTKTKSVRFHRTMKMIWIYFSQVIFLLKCSALLLFSCLFHRRLFLVQCFIFVSHSSFIGWSDDKAIISHIVSRSKRKIYMFK